MATEQARAFPARSPRPPRVALGGLFLNQPWTGSGQYTLGLIRALGETGADPGAAVDLSVIADRPHPTPIGRAPLVRRPRFVTALGRALAKRRAGATALTAWPLLANLAKLEFEQCTLPRAAERLGADLVHYPYFAAPVWSRMPVVVTVHDLIPLILPEYRGSALVQAYVRLVARGTQRAHLVLADSAATQRDITRCLGIPTERIRVIHLAVDERYRRVEPATARAVAARFGLPERFILNVGGFDARKNVVGLVEAFAELRRRGYPGDLALVGRPPETPSPLFPDAIGLAARLGVADQTRALGPVSDDDKIALLSACEVMVYPSTYEGFGLPPLEAMACGAPVVTTTAASLPEVVGDAARLVAPDDTRDLAAAIQRLVEDSSQKADYAVRGPARAAQFTWTRVARQTTAAYWAALARPGDPPR